MSNSFDTKSKLDVNGNSYEIFDVSKCSQSDRLPYSIKILLENLLRYEDGTTVTKTDIEEILNWDSQAEPSKEIAFRPARVLMQDFTGVPAIVDLAAMRDAMKTLGGDPEKINPLQPAEMVIDHSVQVDNFGSDKAVGLNEALEFSRNQERYSFLKWGNKINAPDNNRRPIFENNAFNSFLREVEENFSIGTPINLKRIRLLTPIL